MARVAGIDPNGAGRHGLQAFHAFGWGLARALPIWRWRSVGRLLAASGTVTPFQLPRLSAVLARIWTDAVAGDLALNAGADALSRPRRLRHRRDGWRRPRHGHVAQRRRALAVRSDRVGRLSHAQDRLPARHHALARRLRSLQDRHGGARRHLPGRDGHHGRHRRRRPAPDLVGAQHGRQRARGALADRAARRRPRRS